MAGCVTRGSAVPAIELEPSVAVSEPYSKHITHVPVVSCCRCAHGLILRAHGRYPASSSHWGAARFDSSVRRARPTTSSAPRTTVRRRWACRSRICVISRAGMSCEGVSGHISGVFESLAVILGVLSVLQHGRFA